MLQRIAVRYSLALLALAALVPTLAHGETLQRTFRYSAASIHVRAHDGVVDLALPGAMREFRPGHPDLPLASETVELPAGFKVGSVRITDLRTVPLAGGVRVPSAMVVKPGLGAIERTAPAAAWFQHAGFQPEVPVTLGYQGWERGRHLALLQVCPVQWDAISGDLQRVDQVSVALTLVPDDEKPLLRQRIVPEWENARMMGVPGQVTVFPRGQTPGLSASRTALQKPVFAATNLPSLLGSPVAYVIVTGD